MPGKSNPKYGLGASPVKSALDLRGVPLLAETAEIVSGQTSLIVVSLEQTNAFFSGSRQCASYTTGTIPNRRRLPSLTPKLRVENTRYPHR